MSKTTQAKKAAKAKKPAEKTAAATGKVDFCCQCKSHDNRPSYCRKHKKYVGRKAAACQDAK